MFSRLWSEFVRVTDSISAIADSLFALADTFRQANAVIRERCQLEALPSSPEQPALPPASHPSVADVPACIEPETTAKANRRSRNSTPA